MKKKQDNVYDLGVWKVLINEKSDKFVKSSLYYNSPLSKKVNKTFAITYLEFVKAYKVMRKI